MSNKFKEKMAQEVANKLVEMGYSEVDKNEYDAAANAAKVFLRTRLNYPHGMYFIAHQSAPLKGEYIATASGLTSQYPNPRLGSAVLDPAGIDTNKALGKKFKVTVEEIVE